MKISFLVGMAFGAMMLGMAGLAQASTYNATTDFSITNGNPNGVWTYGWMPSDFSIFSANTTPAEYTSYDYWMTANSSMVAFNDTGTTILHGVAPGQLFLHPGVRLQVAVLRFIAPIDGLYDIDGQFFAGDWGVMQVGVRQGTDWLMQGSDAGLFSIDDHILYAGNTVDFVVYGGYDHGSTPLALAISSVSAPVPVPGAALLLGSGLLGLAGLDRRKKTAVA